MAHQGGTRRLVQTRVPDLSRRHSPPRANHALRPSSCCCAHVSAFKNKKETAQACVKRAEEEEEEDGLNVKVVLRSLFFLILNSLLGLLEVSLL